MEQKLEGFEAEAINFYRLNVQYSYIQTISSTFVIFIGEGCWFQV